MLLTRVTLATASSLLVLATLAACGGGDDDTATDRGGPGTSQEGGSGAGFEGGPAGGPGGGLPGAFGKVAAVSGKTAQVQNEMTGQVAVSWTSGTDFTQQVDGSLDDVQVGSCVLVGSDDDAGSTEITATSVRVMDECRAPTGTPTDRPSDLPSGPPSDAPSVRPGGGPGRPGGFGTVGEVTAVSGDGFTVTAGENDVTVKVSGDTTYTTTAKATADAVKVGACVTAQGHSDDTGAVAATSISVSQQVDGQCTGGFGVFLGRPGAAS
jgi:Domain of unknown function (DUF5666)